MATSPRFKNKTLLVLAVEGADVREIDEHGAPIRDVRFVGKTQFREIKSEGHILPYHSHYISRLKDGSLLALDQQTAELAGVSFFIGAK